MHGPPRVAIVFGVDPTLGFFVTVAVPKRTVTYDSFSTANYDGLSGVIRALVASGIVDNNDVAEATRLLPHVLVDDIENDRVRLVAHVITSLRHDANEAGPP